MAPSDEALEKVARTIDDLEHYKTRVGRVLRNAFDEVIDGPRTQRWNVRDLEKVEKTYIGTKVELLLRAELGFERGKSLDYKIASEEIDAKFTLKKWGWMIPSEALDHLCLLLSADDDVGRYDFGIVRARPEYMTLGKNKDGKRHLSAEHRDKIRWFVQSAPFPRNFLMHSVSALWREQIFRHPPGQARVNALFTTFQNRPIPADVIATLGQEPVDVVARTANAEAALRETVCILAGDNPGHRQLARDEGLIPPESGEYMSVSRYRLAAKVPR